MNGGVSEVEVERAAKAIERATTARAYGWTDEQFEVWWSLDPEFVERRKVWGDFTGTEKQRVLWIARIAIEAARKTAEAS